LTRAAAIEIVVLAGACAWLLLFAHGGLGAPFSGDDLMNLHGYLTRPALSLLFDNLRYWSTSYRPLGGLFYVGLYRLFGFDPLPFRMACFLLLAINLGLLGRFTQRLSGSREVAALALLLAGYHAWFVDLYYSSGTVYDLLCYCFFLAAFNVYLGVRSQGRLLSWRNVAIVSLLYVCALDAKEMAVTLPVLLALYELIYHGGAVWRGRLRGLGREGKGVAVTAVLTVPYVIGKLTGAGSLVENPAYRVSVSPGRFLDAFHLYLNPLFYQEHFFRDPNTIQLMIALLAIAIWRRSRPLLFAWCFVLISLLPVAFINHYSGFFLYLPMAGWSLYGAVVLVMLRKLLTPPRFETASVVAMTLLIAVFLAPQHWRESAKTLHIYESAQPPVRETARQVIALRPTLPRGARVLFIGDPFPSNEYFLYFLTDLLYHDMTIDVEKGNAVVPGRHYDAIFRFENGHLKEAT
jgi:hypothetical protein